MDETLLNRLQQIIDNVETLSDTAKNFTVSVLNTNDLQEAELTCKKLEVFIKRFDTELNNYFRLCSEPSADDVSRFTSVQLIAEEAQVELSLKLQNLNTVTNNSRPTSAKLPKLSLPVFKGEILKWQEFWDQFQSNIHNQELPDIDKLLYLKSSLEGSAKKTIEGLESTSKNYAIAVTTLKERYGKNGQVVDAHYSALSKILPADNSNEDCRRVLDEVERHLRVLNSLGENINHNHLRFLILEKFPEELVYELKTKLKTDSIQDIRSGLENIITAREEANRLVQDRKPMTKSNNYTSETLHTSSKHRRLRPEPYRDVKEEPVAKRTKRNCIFCGNDHYNEECLKYKTLIERQGRLRERCFLCFRKGHQKRNCNYKISCAHCNAGHNRALCPKKLSQDQKTTTSMHINAKADIVLQTAVVRASKVDDNSTSIQCRILMDSGSQRSYVTERIAKKLKLNIEEESRLSVFTFGTDTPLEYDSSVVKIHLKSRTNTERTLHANVVPMISHYVPYPHKILDSLREDYDLADDGSRDEQVDILIGNDLYFSVLSSNKVKIDENLYLIDSEFGWILSGQLPSIERLEPEAALDLHKTTRQVFTEISMNLRSWNSNSKELLQQASDTCKDQVVKVLGLDWHVDNDTLKLRCKTSKQEKTKREVLRNITEVYDPCGYAAPFLLPAKLFLQNLWKESNYKWDAKLSPELMTTWEEINSNLSTISDVSIHRHLPMVTEDAGNQLHCFTDASTKAYATVVYLISNKGKGIIIGKSRLVPIKDKDSFKIPRLELLGALIGNRLLRYAENEDQPTILMDGQSNSN